MSVAVLLIAHGSRRSAANDDLVLLADEIRGAERYHIIEVSYLELAEPTIAQGGRRCVAAGATEVLMMPYFLSAGMHVVEDLREHRRQLAEEFPGTRFQLCPPLGLHPLMAEIVLARLDEGQRAVVE
jgi:sirohydrochlorin ferrochelatase